MKKKLLVLLFMVVAIVTVLAISVGAAEPDSNNKTVTLDDGTVCPIWDTEGNPLIWYVKAEKTDSTPREYGYISAIDPAVVFNATWSGTSHGKKVYQIGYSDDSFKIVTDEGTYYRKDVVVLNMQSDKVVCTTGSYKDQPVNCFLQTFQSCSNLEYVYFRLDTVALNGASFKACPNIKETNLHLLTELVSLSSQDFNGCKKLYANSVLDLSNTDLRSIGSGAFSNWTITGLILPETVTGFGSWALQYLPNLKTFHFPSSVQGLPTEVLQHCTSLESVTGFFDAIARGNNKTSIPTSAFNGCTSLTTIDGMTDIELPSAITSIGNSAFAGTKIKSISGENLTSIGNYAFKGSSVESITTEKVTYYGENCFENTTALKTVVLNENLTTIPTNFFKNAKGITHITIPASVTTFKGYSFEGCSNLTEVNNLSDSFTSIGGSAFSGTQIKSFHFPSNLTSIGQSAFAGCSLLESVELPSTVTTIEQAAFKSCSSLTYFKIPEGITQIAHDLLKDCYRIETLVVPRGCTSIYSQYSVAGMSGLKTIIYTGAENSDFIVNHVNKHLSSATVVYSNHCDVYYAGVHTEVGEAVYSWLDKEGNQGQPFLSYLKVHTECGRECGKENVKAHLAPLFVDRGFAYGPNSMLQGVAVDRELLDEYGNYFTGIKYGLVAAAKSAQASASIIDANGVGANGYVAAVDYTERDYDLFEMNLFGISEDYQATEFYFGAYVIADGQVYYIHNGTTNNEAQAITYDDVVVIVDALVPEKEEE